MAFKDDINNIVNRFKTVIADEVSGLLVQYPNAEDFTKPKGSRWVRVTINPNVSSQVSLGENKRFRNPGIMTVSIFIPAGSGTAAAWDIADLIDIETAFRNVTADGIKYLKPSAVAVGRIEGEWQLNVDCPYFVDDIES